MTRARRLLALALLVLVALYAAWFGRDAQWFALGEVALAVAIVLAASLTGLRARFAARASRH